MAKNKSRKQKTKQVQNVSNSGNWSHRPAPFIIKRRTHKPEYSPSYIPIVDNTPVWSVERIAFSPRLVYRATFLSLPTEVIARILVFGFESSRPYDFPLDLASTENGFRTAALSVCHRLYTIVLSIPKLWSYINIKAPPVRGKGLRRVVYKRLEAHLTRSGNHPLDIQLEVTWPEGDIRHVMKRLGQQAHRWRKLSISASGSCGPTTGAPPTLVFSLLPTRLDAGHMPELKVLVLSYEPDEGHGQNTPIVLKGKSFCRWNIPHLQLLHLNNIDLRLVTTVVLGEYVSPPPFTGLGRIPPAFPCLTNLHIAGKSPWPARCILEAFLDQAPLLRNVTLQLKEPLACKSIGVDEGTSSSFHTLETLDITSEPYHPEMPVAHSFNAFALSRMSVLRHDFQNRTFKDFCDGTSMVVKGVSLRMAFNTLPARHSELVVSLELCRVSWPLWCTVSSILESLTSMKKLVIREVDVEVAMSAMFDTDEPEDSEQRLLLYGEYDGLMWHRLRRLRRFPHMPVLNELSIDFKHPFGSGASDSGEHTSDCDCPRCDQEDATYRGRTEGDNWLRSLTASFLAIFVHNSPSLHRLSLKHLTPVQWSAVACLFSFILEETDTFGRSPCITELTVSDIHQDRGRVLFIDRRPEDLSDSEYEPDSETEDEDESDPDETAFGEGISSNFPNLRVLELNRVPVAGFLEDLEMDENLVDLEKLTVTHCAQARRSKASWPHLCGVLEARRFREVCVDAEFARAHMGIVNELKADAECLLKVVE